VPERLKARHLPACNSRERYRTWVQRLKEVDVPSVPVRELYMGEHWQVALSLPKVGEVAGVALELWVVSAGYGLLHEGDLVKPYAATFTPGLPDSLIRPEHGGRRTATSDWWAQMALWRGPTSGNPRSLGELAKRNPADYLIVALGSTYLEAVLDDVDDARSLLDDPALLLVVSAGTRPSKRLGSNLIPVDSSHQQYLGGTRLSLNVRAARWLVATSADHRFDHALVARKLAERRTQSATANRTRRRMSDPEVSAYIRDQLKRHTVPSKTALLRRLRDHGKACEQARFARLFSEATSAQ
jgi:hypothetical protein